MKQPLKQTLFSLAASLILVAQAPLLAWAADADTGYGQGAPQDQTAAPADQTAAAAPTDSVVTPEPPKPETGPATPPGADSNQYTYNPATGKWESAKYIWDPATGQTSPKGDPGYYYNPETKTWDTNQYVYHPETGKYEAASVAKVAGPAAAAQTGAAVDPSTTVGDVLAALLGLPSASNSNTGPGSNNFANVNSSNSGFFDLFSRAAVTNNLTQSSVTGDASISGNTLGGNAISGAASAITNLLNLLNSGWSWASGGLNYFVKNLFGDHTGDINLNPGSADSACGSGISCGGGSLGGGSASNSGTGPNSNNVAGVNGQNDFTVNNQANGQINNNLNLLAQSGNAGVTGNTQAGNATSGDATANLNIVNLINSMIGAGQSFFGLLNIFGNLNGDILFPQGFLDQAMASQAAAGGGGASASNSLTGPNSTNQAGVSSQNNTNVNNQVSSAFNNNLNTRAQSGQANVADNTAAGSATTGSAKTNTDLFNLTNTSLFGDNAVLVLVNVLGHWVGQIMNLPTSGNSASGLLTGGVAVSNNGTGPDSTNQANVNQSNNTTVNNNVNGQINNNINAGALSGDASVNHNSKGGNATSGNSSVAANVANFFGSTLNLKKWFGILVINVFGDWTGSVNEDTAAGNISAAVGGGSSPVIAQNGPVSRTANSGSTIAGGGGGSAAISSGTGGGSLSATDAAQASVTKVLSAKQVDALARAKTAAYRWYFLLSALALGLAAALFGLDRRTRHGR